MWYHWFNIRIREYRLLEIVFFACLFMIFYRLQTISNQNDRVLEMVSAMERKLEALAAQEPDQDIRNFDRTQPLEQSDGAQKTKLPTRDSTDKMRSPALKMNKSTTNTDNSTLKVPFPKELFRFNAADYLLGAYVETHLSSRSSLYSINQWESNLVLLDRLQPPADKAWCSNDENPGLTIDLAKYIKPISVSYQHSKWNEKIPKEAPKTYDVVACLDCNCKIWEPLALNCQYSDHEPNGSEQMCNISSDLDVRRTGKIQVRFRENYGDPNMTCVNLVRVYGETKTPVKMEKHLNSEKTCADLKWNYHNSYIGYLLWIVDAWKSLPDELIKKSFEGCALTTVPGCSEDHLIHCLKTNYEVPSGLDALKKALMKRSLEELEDLIEEVDLNAQLPHNSFPFSS
ncbi:unnamed protein product [Caenorhabditis nigoni]